MEEGASAKSTKVKIAVWTASPTVRAHSFEVLSLGILPNSSLILCLSMASRQYRDVRRKFLFDGGGGRIRRGHSEITGRRSHPFSSCRR